MTEKRKKAIWIAAIIVIILLELSGVFDWVRTSLFGEEPHVRDAREQAMVEEAYEEGYRDGYEEGYQNGLWEAEDR